MHCPMHPQRFAARHLLDWIRHRHRYRYLNLNRHLYLYLNLYLQRSE